MHSLKPPGLGGSCGTVLARQVRGENNSETHTPKSSGILLAEHPEPRKRLLKAIPEDPATVGWIPPNLLEMAG